jgi:Ran GTPase-activating protein (RanGAP) involved in mRNA processing and transport
VKYSVLVILVMIFVWETWSTNCKTRLPFANLQARGAAEIGKALRHNTGLLILDLADNGLANDGVEAIAVALQTNTSLVELVLANNGIGTAGVTALAVAVRTNGTLHTLSLSGNDLGASGHAAFAMCLRDKTRGLANLDLSNTSINSEAMKALGEGLRDNKSIRSLNLSKNAMGDHGSLVLGDMLANVEVHHVNSCLVHINAEDNNITSAGAKRFLQAIQVNGALLRLDLKGNSIDHKVLEGVEDWLNINRKLSALGPNALKIIDARDMPTPGGEAEASPEGGGAAIVVSVGA